MLRLPGQGPIFLVLDALDECPDSSGIPSPRDEVLQLVKELVDLHLQDLHICATSRPEVDIRAVLEPLAFRSVSLHDESGQKTDIAHYVRTIVNMSPSMAMKRWRDDDKNLVIETLTERADGMFRWVFCQLESLRHCIPSNLRHFLNELPDTLDETYERILRGINKAQKEDARRLLQCLTVAARPLRVEELAELLAFDFQMTNERGVPKLMENWRWSDQEGAVLSTCSSLITIVRKRNSRVVQFSHFSVKEYLTSPRLAQTSGDVSRFHVDLNAAHTILAQACLSTLLQLDEHASDSCSDEFPLVQYAAEHWVVHAQFENVSSRVQDGMDDLFDSSKPHFAAWLRVHNMDEPWYRFSGGRRDDVGPPLYYAAFCGFYDLAGRLIMKHPEQVNARNGFNLAPLPATFYQKHFRVANLLRMHGAVVDVRDTSRWTPLHAASDSGSVDIVRWLLDHGAEAGAQNLYGRTPLHMAAYAACAEAAQVLLEHNVDINSQDNDGETPLFWVFYSSADKQIVDIVQLLLEHGADTNIPDTYHSTVLHQASKKKARHESLDVARLLLRYGARVDEQDEEGRTPFQIASEEGYHEMMALLLEHGAVPPP
ncbi:ankyrin repeat-containing domain protein [Lactarius quietus]|nr:ankyrin repeat-containing domain protein [Lactarius quietus]